MIVVTIVIGIVHEILQAAVQLGKLGGAEFAIHDGTGSGPALFAPGVAVGVGGVVMLFVIPLAKIDHGGGGFAEQPVLGIGFVQEVEEIIPNRDAPFHIVVERRKLALKFRDLFGGEFERHAARDDRFGVGVFAAQHRVGFAGNADHYQRFAIELAGAAIELVHQRTDGGVAVRRSELCGGGFGAGPNLGIGPAKGFLGIIGPGKHEKMHRVVVEILATQQQIAGHGAERRRLDPQRHFETKRGRGGMDAAANAG